MGLFQKGRVLAQDGIAPQREDILLRSWSLLHDATRFERQPYVLPCPARQIHLLRKPLIGLGSTDRVREDLLLSIAGVHDHSETHRDEQSWLPHGRRRYRKAQRRVLWHSELEGHHRRERRRQGASRLGSQREDIPSRRPRRTRLTALESDLALIEVLGEKVASGLRRTSAARDRPDESEKPQPTRQRQSVGHCGSIT